MDSTNANQSAAPAPVVMPPRPARRKPRGRQIKWIAATIVLIGAIGAAVVYWLDVSKYVSTDDAYVNANQVEITAQVSGPVTKVFVRDQQHVNAGDPLFDIDPSNYEVALQKAQAQLDLARQSVSQESAGVSSAEAVLLQRRAEAANALSNWKRNDELTKSGFLSRQGAETSRTQLATARAAVKAAEANVAQARSTLGSQGEENAGVQLAAAAVRQAQLDLDRTHVVSPVNGVVANLTLQPGNTVQPGAPLFVLISNAEFWVDANFKETELVDIHPGQKAIVKSDIYHDREFHGVVQSLSGGSGTAFSLLPAQNATGNWVKVTQRVPGRIWIEDPDAQHPLRIGTTATVKVIKSQ
jgi:membrane fusion protein (multidrug efflux system)